MQRSVLSLHLSSHYLFYPALFAVFFKTSIFPHSVFEHLLSIFWTHPGVLHFRMRGRIQSIFLQAILELCEVQPSEGCTPTIHHDTIKAWCYAGSLTLDFYYLYMGLWCRRQGVMIFMKCQMSRLGSFKRFGCNRSLVVLSSRRL